MKKNKQRQSTVTKFRTRWKNNLKRILVALNLRNYMNISNTKIWSIERGKFELKNVASTVDMKIFSHCNLADACAEPGGTMLTQCWFKICRPHWLESICDIHVRSFVRSPVRVASMLHGYGNGSWVTYCWKIGRTHVPRMAILARPVQLWPTTP